jgi:hypothetical protein
VTVISMGNSPQPGLQLISPSGQRTEKAGDDAAPSGQPRNISALLSETGRYQVRVVSRRPLSILFVVLQGRGQQYVGALDSRSPVGADGIPFVPVELKGFNMANVQAVYTVEVNAAGFEPTVMIVDRKTMSLWPNQRATNFGTHATLTFEVDGYGERFTPDLSLLVLVKPAHPAVRPWPAGPVTLDVQMVQGGGS